MEFNEIQMSELEKVEKKIIWSFTSIGTIGLSKLMFKNKAEFFNEPFLGQHMGIITDRRGKEIVTNFDIHKNRKDYFFNLEFKEYWMPFLQKLITTRIAYQFERSIDPIIINDLPAANFGADFLVESTPKSRGIYFVRDGRDVLNDKIMSVDINGIKNGLESFSKENMTNLLILEARKWKKMTDIIVEIFKKNPKRCKIIKVEKLNGDEIRKTFDFLEIKYNNNDISQKMSEVEKYAKENFHKFGNWQSNFTDEQKNEVMTVIKNSLNQLEYETY